MPGGDKTHGGADGRGPAALTRPSGDGYQGRPAWPEGSLMRKTGRGRGRPHRGVAPPRRGRRGAVPVGCTLVLVASSLGALVASDAFAGTQGVAQPAHSSPRPASSSARVPAGLQAAIDKTLAAQPVTSPAGVSLSWGERGRVSFRLVKGPRPASGCGRRR